MNRQQRRAALKVVKKSSGGGWTALERVPGASVHVNAPTGLAMAFRNETYSVQVYHPVPSPFGEVTPIGVRRHDCKPAREWYDLWRIKNEVAGSDAVAVEVYPANDDLCDQANMYWLWVLPKGTRFRFRLS